MFLNIRKKSFFKEHCYKKKRIVIRKVDQISIANLITQLFKSNFA